MLLFLFPSLLPGPLLTPFLPRGVSFARGRRGDFRGLLIRLLRDVSRGFKTISPNLEASVRREPFFGLRGGSDKCEGKRHAFSSFPCTPGMFDTIEFAPAAELLHAKKGL